MKLYLDTNIIIGWFKRMMQSTRNGDEFTVPSVMQFLGSQDDMELFVSNLTKTEVYRYLKSEWNASPNHSEDIWRTFIKSFEIEYIETAIPAASINNLLSLCQKTHTKKNTLTNLLHLEIASNYKLQFLTGEKDLKDRYDQHYKNVITYSELRQKLSGPSHQRP